MFSEALRTKPGEWDRACRSAVMLLGARPLTATSGKKLQLDQAEVLSVPWIQFASPYHPHKGGVLAIK